MAQKGDFIGFTFNGTHSSDLGIVRTSNGSRYNSNLLPSSSDQTVAVPGGDGVYFFGTNYQTRIFLLLIASDEISEVKMKQIKIWLGDKLLHDLRFDEAPYKVYTAKCTNMPLFNFLCFDENGSRVYKGEGSIEFTAYYPYARSLYKFLDDYGENENPHIAVPEWNSNEIMIRNSMLHNHHLLGNDHIDINTTMLNLCNINEWAAASGMKQSLGNTDKVNSPSSEVFVYNPGDIETDFLIWIRPGNCNGIRYYYRNNTTDTDNKHFLLFNFSSLDFSDPNELYYILYDSKTELLTGYTDNNGTIGQPNGKLYNKYITKGDFFKIPVNADLTQKLLLVSPTNPNTGTINKIEYNYLYY